MDCETIDQAPALAEDAGRELTDPPPNAVARPRQGSRTSRFVKHRPQTSPQIGLQKWLADQRKLVLCLVSRQQIIRIARGEQDLDSLYTLATIDRGRDPYLPQEPIREVAL